MNYQKAFIMPCNKHESKKVGFLCTKAGCKERLICANCYKSHPESHKDSFISVMEIFAEDFATEYYELQKIIERAHVESENAETDLDSQFEKLKLDFLDALEDVKKEIKNDFKPVNLEDQGVKLKYHKEKIMDFLDMSEELVIASRFEIAESISSFMDLRTQIQNAKIQTPYIYKQTKQHYETMKKTIKGMLSKQSVSFSVSNKAWNWSTTKKSSDLVITDEGMTVKLPSGSGNHGIIGDITMTEGTYEWNIEHDPNIKEGFWGIGFGIISKKQLGQIDDWESFPYSKALCRSTSGTVHNLNSIEKVNLKGKIAQVKLDLDEGNIKFFSEGKLLAEGSVKKGEEYVPFLDFNHTGYAKLSF